MRLIDADANITALIYDEEHEETNEVKMTIADFLDGHTEEGCPQGIGWISVKDRLPNKSQADEYIVVNGGKVEFAMYLDGMWITPLRVKQITHWMPFPEPPKEDE